MGPLFRSRPILCKVFLSFFFCFIWIQLLRFPTLKILKLTYISTMRCDAMRYVVLLCYWSVPSYFKSLVVFSRMRITLFCRRLQIFVAPTSNRSFVTCFCHCIFYPLPVVASKMWNKYSNLPEVSANITRVLTHTHTHPWNSLQIRNLHNGKLKFLSHTHTHWIGSVCWLRWIGCFEHNTPTYREYCGEPNEMKQVLMRFRCVSRSGRRPRASEREREKRKCPVSS